MCENVLININIYIDMCFNSCIHVLNTDLELKPEQTVFFHQKVKKSKHLVDFILWTL